MLVKTSKLIDGALDWAVSKSLGIECRINKLGGISVDTQQDKVPDGMNPYDDYRWQGYSPSRQWAQGGSIIEREKISTCWEGTTWVATLLNKNCGETWCGHQYGSTPLIAAMRCYVASKLGDEIDVPDELVI